MREIIKDELIYARIIRANEWNEGLSFFSKDEEYVQVGTWVYPEGKELAAHVHNFLPRDISHTQEVLFIKKGKIEASIFDKNNYLFSKIELNEGDIIILLNGGHGYKILENNTQVLEIKNGPYLGAEADRKRI